MDHPRLLLIDDDLVLGDLLVEVLRKRGHAVAWFVRAELIGDVDVRLMHADGKTSLLNARDHDLALVDGRLRGSSIDGWDLTPRLVAAGLPVIGLSGAEYFNDLMVKAGARKGMSKDKLFFAVMNGEDVFSDAQR